MKRLSITILALLISFVASAQVPYKIHNNKLYLIWNGDTLKFKIYGDSTSIGGGNRLNFSHDSLYFPHLKTGATDTNIMFVRGSDGKMMYLRPADIGIGNSYWSKNGVIHPTDTTNAVAIGTNSAPAGTMLRVNDGSVLFEGSTGTTPVSGEGTRMMWIPEKAAFRAGYVDGTQWDNANIGNYSFSNGYKTLASGISSFAIGDSSRAIGKASFAGGRGKAYGDYSFAWGDSCRTSTSGSYGVAMGYGNKVTGQYGIAFGQNCAASGYASTVSGYSSTASNTASTAFGYYVTASGVNGAFACGQNGVAGAKASFVANIGCTATGEYSSSIGNYSSATGENSFSSGISTVASGYGSFTQGWITTAQSYVSSALGRYNIARGTKGSWVSTDDLFVLGNGTGTGANSNNAITILKNGTAYIGDASSTTDPILTVSTTDSTTTLIGILKLTPQDDPPVSASEGMIYADTDHHLYYYNGTAWVQLD